MAAKMERTKYPGIYRRGSRYVIVWRHRGKQHKESFRTLAEAREAQGKRRQAGERRAYSRQYFDEYAEYWLDSYSGRTSRGLSESTRRDYRRSIETWVIPFFRRYRLAEIEPPDVRRFVTHMQQEGAQPPSVRKNVAPLKALFATAYEDGHVPSNPTAGLRLPTAAEDDVPRAKAMSQQELRLVLAAIPEQHRLFFVVLAQSGMRISEALGLTWADIDLGAQPKLMIRWQHYRGVRQRLKTKHSRRDVPLSRSTAEALRQLRANTYTGEEAPVFATRVGTPLSAHNLRKRVLDPATKPLGLHWVTFHTFRHTRASILFQSKATGGGGKDVKQVQEWLGHADPGFTLRTYVHLMDEGLGDADFLDEAVLAAG
jgi:integrase